MKPLKYLELNPNSGDAYGHLGIAYARMANKDLARLNSRMPLNLFQLRNNFKEELKKLGKEKTAL